MFFFRFCSFIVYEFFFILIVSPSLFARFGDMNTDTALCTHSQRSKVVFVSLFFALSWFNRFLFFIFHFSELFVGHENLYLKYCVVIWESPISIHLKEKKETNWEMITHIVGCMEVIQLIKTIHFRIVHCAKFAQHLINTYFQNQHPFDRNEHPKSLPNQFRMNRLARIPRIEISKKILFKFFSLLIITKLSRTAYKSTLFESVQNS